MKSIEQGAGGCVKYLFCGPKKPSHLNIYIAAIHMYTPHIYTLRATDTRCASTSNIPADRIPFHLSVIRCATGKLKKGSPLRHVNHRERARKKKHISAHDRRISFGNVAAAQTVAIISVKHRVQRKTWLHRDAFNNNSSNNNVCKGQ